MILDPHEILNEAKIFLNDLPLNELSLILDIHDKAIINGDETLQKLRSNVDETSKKSIIDWLTYDITRVKQI